MHSLLEQIAGNFPLTKMTEQPVTFSASGMDFTTDRYSAEGLGSVSLMSAVGMGGGMRMTTLIVNPFQKDAPLFSLDRIQAMGQEMLYLELFDTTLSHEFDVDWIIEAKKLCETVPDKDPGQHWYDSMRMGEPIVKAGTVQDEPVLNMTEEAYLAGYLNACHARPACDAGLKSKAAMVYSEGLLAYGGPATDPVKAELGPEATAEFFRNTLFGTNEGGNTMIQDDALDIVSDDAEIDIVHFQQFWKEQQKSARHMEREEALEHIEGFIKAHNTCALATGTGDFVRCTPIEYTYMDGEFYLYSEGGDKFIGLEQNKHVSLAVFEYYGDRNDSHGLQVTGKAVLYPPRCEMFRKVLAFKGIPYDVMKAAKVDVALIRIIPEVYEMYDTDFVKAGYDVRQIVRF